MGQKSKVELVVAGRQLNENDITVEAAGVPWTDGRRGSRDGVCGDCGTIIDPQISRTVFLFFFLGWF